MQLNQWMTASRMTFHEDKTEASKFKSRIPINGSSFLIEWKIRYSTYLDGSNTDRTKLRYYYTSMLLCKIKTITNISIVIFPFLWKKNLQEHNIRWLLNKNVLPNAESLQEKSVTQLNQWTTATFVPAGPHSTFRCPRGTCHRPDGLLSWLLLLVIKDSPQPHCPFEFGLMNMNSDLQ